jgi:hypothetical protein
MSHPEFLEGNMLFPVFAWINATHYPYFGSLAVREARPTEGDGPDLSRERLF